MYFRKSLFFVFTVFVICDSAFVDNLEKCKINDGDCQRDLIQSVIRDIAKVGVPELGIPILDPMILNNISVPVMNIADIELMKVTVKGIKDCIIDKFNTEIENGRASLELTCDLTIKGQYRVFSDSPLLKNLFGAEIISGNGNAKVKIEKLKLRVFYSILVQKRDGEIYIVCNPEKNSYSYDIEKMTFTTDNLYIGNTESTSYISSCSRNDPKLNECALKSARDSIHQFSLGDPERGLNSLDPLYVAEMTVFIPNKQGLKVIFKDNYFTGLSKLHMENLKFDLENKLILADALVTLNVKNTYDLSGRLLGMAIKSTGDSSINLKNALLHMRFWYEHVEGSDGKIHWKIYKNDIKYEVEKASFRLDNLLSDKNIGDQINRLLNEMWREIVNEVGPSICQSLSSAVVENVAVLLEQVPYDELMPE